MITANKKLRNFMKINNVPYWKLAAALNVTEQTIIRWLRFELPKDKTEMFLQKVTEIAETEEEK